MESSDKQTSRASSVNALSIGYIKILKVFLTLSASWPYQVAGGKTHPAYWFYGRIGVGWALLAISGEIWFLIENCKILSFYELGHMYLTLFFAVLAVIRALLPLFSKYGVIVERLLLSFHLIYFKHKGSSHQKMYEKIDWLSHRIMIITIILTILTASAFTMFPIVNNISSGAYTDRNKTVDFSIYFSYPGFDPQDHYKFVTGWNFFLAFVCAILIGGIDALIILFIFQVIGHIEILNDTLRNFPKPGDFDIVKEETRKTKLFEISTLVMFAKEENLIIAERIKKCVEHHLLIISFTDDVSGFFGPVIAIYYLFHQVAGCIMLLEMSAGGVEALTLYGSMTIAVLGQLVIISTIFEVVNTKSEQLVNAMYCLPWESMSLSNQRSVCFLLHRLQTPIAVTALGITSVNVQTMATILKTSFSYYTFLKTLKD